MKTTKIEIKIQHEDLNLVGLIEQVKGLEKEKKLVGTVLSSIYEDSGLLRSQNMTFFLYYSFDNFSDQVFLSSISKRGWEDKN